MTTSAVTAPASAGWRTTPPAIHGLLSKNSGHRNIRPLGYVQKLVEPVRRVVVHLIIQVTMQIGQVSRVDLPLVGLQPVGFLVRLEHEHVFFRGHVPIERWEQRWSPLAHVGVNDAIPLSTRIREMRDFDGEVAPLRLGRLLDAPPLDIVKPAVVWASQPPVFKTAVAQVRAAIAEFGGLKAVMPRFTAAFLILTLASIGLPGLNGFVGEFLIMLGAFRWALSRKAADRWNS